MAIDLTKLEKKFIDLFANVTQEEFEQWLLTKTKHMAQQTVVEWFAEQVEKILIDLKRNNNPFQLELCLHRLNELEEQAKQMEKERIINAYNSYPQTIDINDNGDFKLLSGEQYYNETYGNNQNK